MSNDPSYDLNYEAQTIPPNKQVKDPSTTAPHSLAKAVPQVEQRSTQIGPYKLLQKIGEGGMGTVWMAEQEKPVRRRVALKLIKSELASKEVIARFEAERQALAMMDHQNISMVLDAGTSQTGNPYFVMELIQGKPLNEYCDENELSIPDRLKIMVDVCEAIQHAHQKGILHRDLKPANVLVTEVNGKPVPKVIDFGLAKATEHTTKLTDKTMFTEFGQVVGTLQYMSPEQAEMDSLDIDTRTDIYSLGVMLYELLAGSTPLDQDTLGKNALLQVLEMIREKEPPRPSTRLSSSKNDSADISRRRKIGTSKLQSILKGELDWIVMKAIDKKRKRRYESASDFAKEVSNYLNGDTVKARPPTIAYKMSKFTKRNRGLVGGVSLVFLTLLLGIVGTSIGLFRAAAATAESRSLLAHQYASNGVANIQNGDFCGALPWLGAALEIGDSESNMMEKRLSAAINNTPKIGGVFTHEARVNDVELSPDGVLLASASSDGQICVWKLTDGVKIACFEITPGTNSVSFHPKGGMLLSVSSNVVWVWNLENKSLSRRLEFQDSVRQAEFGENETLFVADRKGNAGVWSLGTCLLYTSPSPRDS